MAVNRCEFIGNLGADPEVRKLNSGEPVVNLRLAVTERWRDKNSGERKERTDWIPIVIFNPHLCDVAEKFLRKGSKAFIAGQFQTRKYEKDGQDRYMTEIVLPRFGGQIELLDSKGDGDGADSQPEPKGNAYAEARGGSSVNRGPAPSYADALDDEIPF